MGSVLFIVRHCSSAPPARLSDAEIADHCIANAMLAANYPVDMEGKLDRLLSQTISPDGKSFTQRGVVRYGASGQASNSTDTYTCSGSFDGDRIDRIDAHIDGTDDGQE